MSDIHSCHSTCAAGEQGFYGMEEGWQLGGKSTKILVHLYVIILIRS